MTNHVVRLYALVGGMVAFFVAWAAVAAHPWAPVRTTTDPRLAALAARDQRVRLESLRVRNVVAHRFARYRVELRARRRQITAAAAQASRTTQLAVQQTAAPVASVGAAPVRVVTLPPLVITRTS